jgi:hypothetical protein
LQKYKRLVGIQQKPFFLTRSATDCVFFSLGFSSPTLDPPPSGDCIKKLGSNKGKEQRKEKKMNIQLSFTHIRSHLSTEFFTLRTIARREALWAKLMGKHTHLAAFPEGTPDKSPHRRFIGTQDVPVEQIVGSMSRQSDFDHRFRPTNKHLRERWVDVYLTIERDGWLPILLHKVGESYYVEDGHHRVSIAQALGMRYIPARVWEYPSEMEQPKRRQPEPCPEASHPKAYVTVTE